MRTTLCLAALTALLCTSGMALASDCAEQAAAKKLSGAARTSFLKKCERDMGQPSCAATADQKKLAGAARASFLKKCGKDAQQTRCDAAAKEKKLAGAAYNSFVKKCLTNP